MGEYKEFLEETTYCDWKNPSIIRLAREFQGSYRDERQLAIKLFEFVRDRIKYKIGPWNKKASETLSEEAGMCTNSTNLLVALLRACGIKSGYCIYKVVGGESFGHILPNMIKRGVDKDSIHIVAYVYLDDKWIKCDPATDSELSESSGHVSKMTKLVIWDGVSDAVHPIDKSHIISVSEPLANIDYQMIKKPRFIVRNHVFSIGNLFIEFLRKEARNIIDKDQIDKSFHTWLKRNHKMKYYKHKLVSGINNRYRSILQK